MFSTKSFAAALFFVAPTVTWAQAEPDRWDVSRVRQPSQANPQGSLAHSAAGEVGKRQERDAVASVKPTARIQSRIQSRVNLRLQNRIDQNYRIGGSGTSAFSDAADEAKNGNRRARR